MLVKRIMQAEVAELTAGWTPRASMIGPLTATGNEAKRDDRSVDDDNDNDNNHHHGGTCMP
jgi:hypothetical protein